MRAAADYMMQRYRDAHTDIEANALDNDRHAALWRGLIEAALENWDAARKALAMAEPVVHRYPPAWQARVRLAQADVALAGDAVEAADAALSRLPKNLPRDLALEAELVRARLYAAEGRFHDAHALFAALADCGQERVAAVSTRCASPARTSPTKSWRAKRRTTCARPSSISSSRARRTRCRPSMRSACSTISSSSLPSARTATR
jgi:hypothetical protein